MIRYKKIMKNGKLYKILQQENSSEFYVTIQGHTKSQIYMSPLGSLIFATLQEAEDYINSQ